MKKSKKAERRVGTVLSLAVLFALSLVLTPAIWADEGAAGGYQDTSTADTSNFLTRTVNRVGSGLGNLLGVGDLFSELSSADVGHKPRIKPHFAFTQGFISNARLASNQADAAWQARVAPGITISVPSGKLYTEVDYTYGFSTTQGRKTTANISSHNLNALARYDLSADTIIGVGNNIQLSEVPGEPGEPFVLETLTGQVKHRLGSKLTGSLTDTAQWFGDKSETRANDFFDNGVAGALSYDVTADLSVGPSFAWNIRDFSKLQTKDYWQIVPGVNAGYRLGPKTTLGANFGWAFRRFDQSLTGTGRTESELVYGATVSHKLGRKFIWSVSYAKTIADTFDTNFVFKDTPVATNLDNLDREFRVLKLHRIGSSGTYNFNEKNSVNAFVDFQHVSANDHDQVTFQTDGDEKTMETGVGYTYRFSRYITFDVLYAFGRRFSAENNPSTRKDYTFHRVTGGVNITI